MDNQNANNGGFPQNQNPPQGNNQPQGNNPQPAPNPNVQYENLRTRSVIESSREVAEKELAAREAYNNQILRQQQAAARRNKGLHIAIKILLVIFGIAIFAALVWMIVEIIIGSSPTAVNDCRNADGTIKTSCCDKIEYKDSPSCKEEQGGTATVDGYKCQTDKCKKMTDIIKDQLIIVYDTKFYIYDIKKQTATATTIDSSIDYNAMSSFEWGKGRYYVILQPMTGNLGLYSVTDNAQVIKNTVSEFYSDINHKAYKEMTDVFGKYILVREDAQYRLYDLLNGGTRLVSGANGVFTHGDYIMTFESNGVRRVYNYNGQQIILAKEGDNIYIRDRYIFHMSGTTLGAYDKDGVKQQINKNPILQEMRQVKRSDLINYMNNAENKFYRMPVTRDYSD